MTDLVQGPAVRPCGSCPYRCDVPPGVWAAEEYDRLPDYDGPTAEQPVGVFLCHQADGRVCAGWVACHDMAESMALRMAVLTGTVSPETLDEILDYASPVPVFGSGAEAAEHGKSEIEAPSEKAVRIIDRIVAKRPDVIWGRQTR